MYYIINQGEQIHWFNPEWTETEALRAGIKLERQTNQECEIEICPKKFEKECNEAYSAREMINALKTIRDFDRTKQMLNSEQNNLLQTFLLQEKEICDNWRKEKGTTLRFADKYSFPIY